MCNDKYPSLWYHTEYFHCPKRPLCITYSLPLSLNPGNHLPFAISIALSFLEYHMIGIIHYVDFTDCFSFFLVTCISGSSMTFHGLVNFIALQIFHCLDIPHFIYLFTYWRTSWKKESEVAQSRLTLCDPMDCSLPGSSVHGIFQARVLEWVAIAFSRGSSQPRDQTQVFHTAGRHFTIWATREASS